jgi:hypothetical protein
MRLLSTVMPGLDPGNHVFLQKAKREFGEGIPRQPSLWMTKNPKRPKSFAFLATFAMQLARRINRGLHADG